MRFDGENSITFFIIQSVICMYCILPLDGDQSAVSMRASWAFHTIGLELGVRDLIFKLHPVANKTDWESDDHATAYTGVTFWARVDLQVIIKDFFQLEKSREISRGINYFDRKYFSKTIFSP